MEDVKLKIGVNAREVEAGLSKLNSDIKGSVNSANALKRAFGSLTNVFTSMGKSMRTSMKDSVRDIEAVEKHIDSLGKRAESASKSMGNKGANKKQIDEMYDRYIEADKERDRLENEFLKKKREKENAKSALPVEDFEQIKDETRKAAKEYTDFLEKKSEIDSKYKDALSERDSLAESFDYKTASDTVAKLDDLEDKIGVYRDDISALKEEYSELDSAIKKSNTIIAQEREKMDIADDRRKDTTISKAERDDADDAYSSAKNKIWQQQEKVNEKQERAKEIEKEIAEKEKEINGYLEKQAALREKIGDDEEKVRKVDELGYDLKDLKAEKDKSDKQYERYQKENPNVQRRYLDAVASIKEYERVSEELEDVSQKLNDAKNKADEFHKQWAEASGEKINFSGFQSADINEFLNRSGESAKTLEGRINAVKKSIAEMKKEGKSVEDPEMQEQMQELSALQQSYRELTAEIEKAKNVQIAFARYGNDVGTPNAENGEQEIELLRRRTEAQQKMAELSRAGFGKGYTEYDNTAAELQNINKELSKLQNLSNASSQNQILKDLQQESDNATDRIKQLKKEIDDLFKEGKRTGSMAGVRDEIEARQAELSELQSYQNDNGVTPLGKKILEVKQNLNELQAAKRNMELDGKGIGFKEYENVNEQIARATQALQTLQAMESRKPTGFFQGLAESAKRAAESMLRASHGARTASTHVGHTNNSFKKGLMTIIRYGLGVRGLFALFRRLRSIATQSLDNIAKSSKSFRNDMASIKNSLTDLKNAAGSALQPIVSALAGPLSSIIQMFTQAAYAVAGFFATLTGQAYIYKAAAANDAYAKSAKGAGSAAKEAAKSIAEYDELMVIDQNSGGGGGGGGGAGGPSYTKEMIDGANEYAEIIKDGLSRLFEPIKRAWETEGKSVMDAFKYALQEIWDLMVEIGDSFLDAWEDADRGYRIFQDIFQTIQSIFMTVGNLAKGFREAWSENDLGMKIFSHILDMVLDVTDAVNEMAQDLEDWAADLDFLPLVKSIEKVTGAFEPLVGDVMDGLKALWEEVLLPLGKWTIEEAVPTTIESLSKALEAVGKALDVIKPLVKPVWENFLKPLFSLAGDVAISAIKGVGDAFDVLGKACEKISKLIEDLKKAYNDLKKELSKVQFLKDLKDKIDEAGESIKNFFETTPGKIIKSIAELLGLDVDGEPKTIGEKIMEGIWQGLKDALGITKFEEILNGMIEGLKKIFGIHSPASTMKPIGGYIFDGILEGMLEAVKDVGSWIDEHIFQPIKTAFDKIKEKGLFKGLFGGDDESETKTVTIKGKEDPSFSRIKTAYESVKDRFSTLTANAKEQTAGAIARIKAGFESVKDKTVEMKAQVKQKWSNIKSAWEGLTKNVKEKTADMKAAVKTKASDLKREWTKLTDNVTEKTGDVKAIVKTRVSDLKTQWTTLTNNVKEKTVDMKAKIGTNAATLKSQWTTLTNNVKEKTVDMKARVGTTWSQLSGTWNTLMGHFKDKTVSIGMSFSASATGMTKWLNTNVIGKINTALSKVPILNSVKIPYLAKGAVIPANKEFLAVLGDQKHGTNIETPLSTMIEAFNTALDKRGGTGQNMPPVILQLDGRTVAEVVWDQERRQWKQTGKTYNFT